MRRNILGRLRAWGRRAQDENRLDTSKRDTGKSRTDIDFQIDPLADGSRGRVIRIPLPLFMGIIGLLLAVFVFAIGYACYRAGLLFF